jgi:hypothetical protein
MENEMSDWRGNIYKDEELNEKCEDCGEQAVRNCCIAEGDEGRTHWHGAIHTKDGGLKCLCRKCAEIDYLKMRKRRKARMN